MTPLAMPHPQRPLREDHNENMPYSMNPQHAQMTMRSAPRSQPYADPLPPRQPPPLQYPSIPEPPYSQQAPTPISPRWDSLSASNSPTTSRFPHITPTTSAESWSDPPSRPMTAKSSITDLRGQDTTPVENFSRPRKQSLRQDMPRPRIPNLPLPEQLPDVSNAPAQHSPRYRHNHQAPLPSRADNTVPLNYAPPLSTEYQAEPKSPRTRGFYHQTSQQQHPFVYPRAEGYSTPSPTAASAPWMAGDELRSSFRSQLTASTGFHGNNTERSSVLTKDSSVTSLSANADEPSLEDVMGMYEEGFEDKPESSYNADRDSRQQSLMNHSPSRQNNLLKPVKEDVARQGDASVCADADALKPPKPSSLDNEIRQSKLFFFSPAFASSVAHLAAAGSATDKRDSDKSDDFDLLSQRPSTAADSNSATAFDLPVSASMNDPPSPEASHSEPVAESVEVKPARTLEPPNSGKTTPVFDQPAAEPEEPGSRDRYGFKKANQYVTREQYDNWDKGYSEYLARRKKKWVSFLKENSLMTDRPNRFPDSTKNNAKTKRFIRKGIPPEWRGAAWFYYAGGPAILRAHGGLYDKLLRKTPKLVDQEAIERDLHRTFPDNIKFKPADGSSGESATDSDRDSFDSHTPSPGQVEGEPSIISALRRVLRAFSVYNPRIGYCQSLNFLAGLLLLFVETEEQCFWLLNVITHIYLPGTHEISLEGSKVDLSVLMAEIRDTMPAVWDKIGGDLEAQPTMRPATSKSLRRPARIKRKDTTALSTERLPPITLCMTAWFMSCFIGTLPIETTLRVWDIFFYEGSKTLFRVALSIFKVGEAEVKAVKDPMEMFGVVQAMPRRMIDANALMEACFKRRNGFGHLTQNTIDERRQERRDTAQKERDEQPGVPKDMASGNVTEVEADVRRKGTLFGRKKRDASRPRAAEV